MLPLTRTKPWLSWALCNLRFLDCIAISCFKSVRKNNSNQHYIINTIRDVTIFSSKDFQKHYILDRFRQNLRPFGIHLVVLWCLYPHVHTLRLLPRLRRVMLLGLLRLLVKWKLLKLYQLLMRSWHRWVGCQRLLRNNHHFQPLHPSLTPCHQRLLRHLMLELSVRIHGFKFAWFEAIY